MKTLDSFIRIARFTAVAALVLGWQCVRLQAEPEKVFIHTETPHVHPGEVLVHPSYNGMIPTTYPLIQSGQTKVVSFDHMIHTVDLPVVPKTTPP